MRKFYFLLIAFGAFIKVSCAQATYTWVGGNTGDYQVAASWSPLRNVPAASDILSFNAGSPINVVNVPNQTIGAIAIASGTSSISFSTNTGTNVLSLSATTPLIYTTAGNIQAADFLTIALTNTATFTLSSGTFSIAGSSGGKIIINSALTLTGGTLDFDVTGTGGTTVTGSITFIGGTFNCNNASAVNWTNGANYFHAADGTTPTAIPRCTWSAGSTCTINGLNAGTTLPTNLVSSKNIFANFTWNCAAQTANIDLLLTSDSIWCAGTFTMASTGLQNLQLAGAAGGLIRVDAYTQTGGNVVLQSSSGTTTLRVGNTFSQTGGKIDAVSGSAGGTGSFDLRGTVITGVAALWQITSADAGAQMNIQFNGSFTQTVNIGGAWSAPVAGRCNISVNNSDLISGVSLTGTLKIYNTNSPQTASLTLNGIFTGSGSVAYSGTGPGGLALIYSWIYPQNATAIEFPSSNGPSNLTINNTLGVFFPASFNRTLSGTLNLLGGNLDLGPNTLLLANSSLGSQLVHTAGYITSGTLSRSFPTTGLPTDGSSVNSRFPFGSGVNNRSVNIFFSGALLTGGTAGTISVSHTSAINATAMSITDDIVLDKRSNSYWIINTSGFNLGSGGQTISVTALGTNIGSVDNINTLRLTNAVGTYGTLIATTGTNDAPLVGKSGLLVSDITSKTLYFGSNNTNALQIITFNWNGSVNNDWTTPGNWTGGLGYPSSPTEIADISSTAGSMPSINTGASISVYRLIVGAPITLSMGNAAAINIADNVVFNGSASFASTSTFTYSGDVGVSQNVASVTYGNLTFSGNGSKILPATVTVTGSYNLSGMAPVITGNTFVFAGTGSQKIAAGFYNNLTITGNRGGTQIGLGNLTSFNTIDIAGSFIMTATNYSVKYDYNTINFSSSSTQNIPGFTYGTIDNTGSGTRVFDPLGASDPAHVITVRSFTPGSFTSAVTTGSKIRIFRDAASNLQGSSSFNYNDLEITGNLGGGTLKFSGLTNVMGIFSFTATNFVPVSNYSGATAATINFNGTVDQTIPAIAGFKYDNISYARGLNRNITLQSSGSIDLYGGISAASSPASWGTGYGFIVAGSTVNFIEGSSTIPALQPVVTGGNNYNNITVTGGTRQLGGDMTAGGNVSVTGTDAAPGTLKIGNGSSTRRFYILGNLSVSGTSAGALATGQIDFNTGTSPGAGIIYLTGNLSISGKGQLMAVGDNNGTIIFNGNGVLQSYNNTSGIKNGSVNFTIGNGTTITNLTLLSSIDLKKSTITTLAGILTVNSLSTLNCVTNNIVLGDSSGTASLKLNNGSTFITANTGGIVGAATSGSTGTITDDVNMTKSYGSTASYVLNGATSTPFPTTALSNMLNLTIGANVTLNKNITMSGILDLGSSTLTQDSKNLQFSGLTSTTGRIAADKSSSITISGTVGTVGTLRFAPGFNTTGQFTIARSSLNIVLGSDFTIDKTPLTGNFVSGITTDTLDINGNTFTINGNASGTGLLSGSSTSNLTLGGTAGTLNFSAGKRELKNFTMNNSSTASLGTPLDITAGASAGKEGTVSINGTAILTTNGNLTIKSSSTGTARVAIGAVGGNYINGDVTVERFIDGSPKRGWRLLAAPAYGQTIKQAWQENQAAGANAGTAGYGTILTTNTATWAADGFDYKTNGASLLTYNPTINSWDAFPNTSSQIATSGSNKAYMVFIRGDRSATPTNGPASSVTTLRTKGTLFQGNLPSIAVPAGNFAVIGNNFASAIDFTTTRDANIDQSFSVWDPKLAGAYGLGGYVTFSASTSPAWKPVPAGGSFTTDVPNKLIQSGQGFVVHATGGTGNITLTESSKVTGSAMVFRPAYASQIGSITSNLYSLSGTSQILADGNTVVFDDGYSNNVDSKDALKPGNFGENLGLIRDNKLLVVEARQPVTNDDTIFLNIKKLKRQTYRLEFIVKGFDNSMQAFLEDKFLHSNTSINSNNTTLLDFDITTDSASFVADRFRIVFKPALVLPVTFSNVKAYQQGSNIAVDWHVDNESNIISYEVEKSTDGRTFTKVNTTLAKGVTNLYNWIDNKPASGDNFYRIRSIDNSGAALYSRIAKVSIGKIAGGFKIYPNPVMDGMIGLQMNNIDAGIYTARLINTLGQVVDKNIITHNGGTSSQNFKLPKDPGEGVYQIEITAPGNKKTVLKILVLGNK